MSNFNADATLHTPENKRTCLSLSDCPPPPRCHRSKLPPHTKFPALPFRFDDEQKNDRQSIGTVSRSNKHQSHSIYGIHVPAASSFNTIQGDKTTEKQNAGESFQRNMSMYVKKIAELEQRPTPIMCLSSRRMPVPKAA